MVSDNDKKARDTVARIIVFQSGHADESTLALDCQPAPSLAEDERQGMVKMNRPLAAIFEPDRHLGVGHERRIDSNVVVSRGTQNECWGYRVGSHFHRPLARKEMQICRRLKRSRLRLETLHRFPMRKEPGSAGFSLSDSPKNRDRRNRGGKTQTYAPLRRMTRNTAMRGLKRNR